VFLEPPDQVFKQGWPTSCNKTTLKPYYHVAKSVLGARPVPQNDEPRRHIRRTELFRKVANAEGRESELVDINVFFGNDFDKPTPIGVQEKNRYGALQTSCTYCAECDVGCNTHSKNTVDLNYLFVAENRYEARIKTETLAEKIVPLNADGQEDTGADGEHGYRVYFLDLNNDRNQVSVTTHRVIVSAGTLGSNELLMRCRDVFKTLPAINMNLGTRVSGNGDFLSFVVGGNRAADPNYGPVITQRTDYNLFQDFDRDRAFILEDAGYPNFAAWYTEGIRPGVSHLDRAMRAIWLGIRRLFAGLTTGRLGYAFRELLTGDISYGTCVLLCMGLDRGDGRIHLDENGFIQLDWPYKHSMSLYRAVLDMGRHFKKRVGGKVFVPLPNWWWPMRNNITVHALGGCRLADDHNDGVTSAAPETMGQVFGYKGLYVADGSIVPTAVGANPVATIAALSEKIAEGITGIRPAADL
jgi:cholesterol oxidase